MNSGQPGHLQFISIEQGKLLYNVSVDKGSCASAR
jgi:hypothetical protein